MQGQLTQESVAVAPASRKLREETYNLNRSKLRSAFLAFGIVLACVVAVMAITIVNATPTQKTQNFARPLWPTNATQRSMVEDAKQARNVAVYIWWTKRNAEIEVERENFGRWMIAGVKYDAERRAAAVAGTPARRSGCGDIESCRVCVTNHESATSGLYGAKNPESTASGRYQVLDSTWDGYAGYPRSIDAPPEVQDRWFNEAYAATGTRNWNGSGC